MIYRLRYDTLFIKQVLRGVVGVQRANCNYGRTDSNLSPPAYKLIDQLKPKNTKAQIQIQ